MPRCALAALLGEGGPVRVSVRPCCVIALVGADPPAEPARRESFVCEADKDRLVAAPTGSAVEP